MWDYIHNNKIYNDLGTATVTCGYSGSVTDVLFDLMREPYACMGYYSRSINNNPYYSKVGN